MVDVATHKTLHSNRLAPFPPAMSNVHSSTTTKLSSEVVARDQPPEGDFIYLLPPTIFGFNMIEKKWGENLQNSHNSDLPY
jgi:hypothetical protein